MGKGSWSKAVFGAKAHRKLPGSGVASELVKDVMVGWSAAQALKPHRARRKGKPHKRTAKRRGREVRGKRPSAMFRSRGGKLDALGWLLTAAVILAWPREHSPFDWPFLNRGPGGVLTDLETAQAEALEPGRGRSARHPGEIPLRGWRDIAWRAWTEFNRDNIPQVAGGVTFFGLLAIFPAMAAFVSLYGLFFDVDSAQKQLQLLAGVLPGEALEMVQQQMMRLAQARHSGLGLAFAVSLLLSLWSANAGVKALMVGLNIAFEEKEKRNFFKLNLTSLAFTFGALVFVGLALAATVAVPVVLAMVGYEGGILAVLRWPVMLVVAIGALAALYRYGPSRERERWRWVSWGSVFAAILWLAASLLFSAYVAHFGSYDKTYGSLGAVVGFMTWIWISTITVLFGAEINSEIEHQTAVDTTDGPPALMGARGAYMADTLGKRRPASKAKAKAEAEAPVAPSDAMSGA